MRQLCGCMGWGLRVDREGNLHDTFPVPGEPERWPRTPWRVKVRHPGSTAQSGCSRARSTRPRG